MTLSDLFSRSRSTRLLSSRDQGVQLVNIGQVFQRGAILEVSWKDSNIQGVPDFKGKTIGVWGFGNEFDLYAALAKNITPQCGSSR